MVKVSKKAVVQEQGRIERCHRCSGIMIQERGFELDSFNQQCVNCGDRIDPGILVIAGHKVRTISRAKKPKGCLQGRGKPVSTKRTQMSPGMRQSLLYDGASCHLDFDWITPT